MWDVVIAAAAGVVVGLAIGTLRGMVWLDRADRLEAQLRKCIESNLAFSNKEVRDE